MRYLLVTLLLVLASGCVTKYKTLPPELIHDYCTRDAVLWFDHTETVDYLAVHETAFLREFNKHNGKYEMFCPPQVP